MRYLLSMFFFIFKYWLVCLEPVVEFGTQKHVWFWFFDWDIFGCRLLHCDILGMMLVDT